MNSNVFDYRAVIDQQHAYDLDPFVKAVNDQLRDLSQRRKISGYIKDGVFYERIDLDYQYRRDQLLDELHSYCVKLYPYLFPIEVTMERKGLTMRRLAHNLLEAVIWGSSEKAQKILDAFTEHRGYTLLELNYQSDESRYYVKFEFNP